MMKEDSKGGYGPYTDVQSTRDGQLGFGRSRTSTPVCVKESRESDSKGCESEISNQRSNTRGVSSFGRVQDVEV